MQLNTIYNCACSDGFLGIDHGSVDCIITDPPYVEDVFNAAYTDLSTGASRILKEGGFMAAYCGIFFLPRVISIFEGAPELRYWWTIAQINGDGQPKAMMWHKKAINSWKPILVYSKGKARDPEGYFFDKISGKSEKLYHHWQQSLAEGIALIKRFCPEGGTVCDPFCGSGTIPLAAKLTGRAFIGFDIDPGACRISEQRLEQSSIAQICGVR